MEYIGFSEEFRREQLFEGRGDVSDRRGRVRELKLTTAAA